MTVLVGFVPTPEGRAALRHAGREAARTDSRLLVLDSGGEPEVLDGLLKQIGDEGVDVDRRRVEHRRDPAEDIIAIADAEDASLIVIGLRRRTPVGKLILGSNAQRILLEAGCPVLAVKAEPGEH